MECNKYESLIENKYLSHNNTYLSGSISVPESSFAEYSKWIYCQKIRVTQCWPWRLDIEKYNRMCHYRAVWRSEVDRPLKIDAWICVEGRSCLSKRQIRAQSVWWRKKNKLDQFLCTLKYLSLPISLCCVQNKTYYKGSAAMISVHS